LTGKAPYRFESISLQRRVNKLSVPLKPSPVVRSYDLFAIEAGAGGSNGPLPKKITCSFLFRREGVDVSAARGAPG
jgi:hypothetical protein